MSLLSYAAITEYIPVNLIPAGTDMSKYIVVDQVTFDALYANNQNVYDDGIAQVQANQAAAEAAEVAAMKAAQSSGQ